jgi:hypothetical protein
VGTAALLAGPVRWTGVAICAVAMSMHLQHGLRSQGAHRLWHGGHAFMAAAMAWMLLPTGLATASAPLWFVGCAGGAGAALVVALLRRWDGVRVDSAWMTLIPGLAAMAYMALMEAGIAAAPVTYAVASVLACETLGWFTGVLPGTARSAPSGSSARVAVLGRPEPPAVVLSTADRLLLGLLGLAMAYLFVVMQHSSMPTM